jgi:hypothetical protein
MPASRSALATGAGSGAAWVSVAVKNKRKSVTTNGHECSRMNTNKFPKQKSLFSLAGRKNSGCSGLDLNSCEFVFIRVIRG